jgi:hypothetical protein
MANKVPWFCTRDHLRLLVEVVTGTVIDDLGNVSALQPEEWAKRKT